MPLSVAILRDAYIRCRAIITITLTLFIMFIYAAIAAMSAFCHISRRFTPCRHFAILIAMPLFRCRHEPPCHADAEICRAIILLIADFDANISLMRRFADWRRQRYFIADIIISLMALPLNATP